MTPTSATAEGNTKEKHNTSEQQEERRWWRRSSHDSWQPKTDPQWRETKKATDLDLVGEAELNMTIPLVYRYPLPCATLTSPASLGPQASVPVSPVNVWVFNYGWVDWFKIKTSLNWLNLAAEKQWHHCDAISGRGQFSPENCFGSFINCNLLILA